MAPTRRSFPAAYATTRSGLDLSELTPEELLRSLDPHREAELGLTPWRRAYHAGLRAVMGA